jgi:hypothetical protein
LLLLLLSNFLTLQQFSWFSRQHGSHWPSTAYSLFCQNFFDYTVCVEYYCLLH